MLIESDGRVRNALCFLAERAGLGGYLDPRKMNEQLQREWVKAKDGTFRAQLGGRFPTKEEMAFLNQLGMVAEIPINFGIPYQGILLLGATLKSVTRRVHFMLRQEEDAGWHFTRTLFLLGSTRKLDPEQEMPEHVPAILEETGAVFNEGFEESAQGFPGSWPKDEVGMMDKVLCWVRRSRFDTTEDWLTLRVCAPEVSKPDGTKRAANTAETVKEWLRFSPEIGRYLIISSQPFCENQLMAVRRAVQEAGATGYTFDVCGPTAPPLPLSRWLDNLAKQLWEEVQLLPK